MPPNRQSAILYCEDILWNLALSYTCNIWLQSQQLAKVVEWVPGIGKCPYSPSFNNTAMMTEDGNLYAATVMDFIGQDPAIYRIMGPSTNLRTLQYNSKWLNGMSSWLLLTTSIFQ